MSTTMTAPNRLNGYAPRIMPHQTPPYTVPEFAKSWDIRTLPNGWGICIRDIGPADAEKMLQVNASNQRKLIKASVERYAKDMANGTWLLTHQGVAFNKQGFLHDGQNRLTAVCESGAIVPMMIFFGAGDNPEMGVIDGINPRKLTDAAHVFGMQATKDTAAVISHLVRYATGKKNNATSPTRTQMVSLIAKYGDKADTVSSWFAGPKAKGTNRAPIKAAVLAAMLSGHDSDKLERFAHVVTDKIATTEIYDTAGRCLRQFIQNNIKGGASGGAAAGDIFLRSCNAITYTVNGVECKVLRTAQECPFVIDINA